MKENGRQPEENKMRSQKEFEAQIKRRDDLFERMDVTEKLIAQQQVKLNNRTENLKRLFINLRCGY